jgi:hypothetical protein
MEKVGEITAVLVALVLLPLVIAVVARSDHAPSAAPAALVQARRTLSTTSIGGARIRLSGCTWSAHGSHISCLARGPGTGVCTFDAAGNGSCHGSSGDTSWFLEIGSDHRG